MDCEKCRKRLCRFKPDFLRRVFFSYGKEAPRCDDFEPNYHHGLEGVWS